MARQASANKIQAVKAILKTLFPENIGVATETDDEYGAQSYAIDKPDGGFYLVKVGDEVLEDNEVAEIERRFVNENVADVVRSLPNEEYLHITPAKVITRTKGT